MNIHIAKDAFGIREIYSTKSGGEEWHMNTKDPNHDSRTNPQTTLIKKNNYNSGHYINNFSIWNIQNTKVRYEIYTTSGYHPELITTLNQSDLSKKGYIQSPNDWKNVEITGYFKINRFTNSTQNGEAHIEMVARGGKNTNDQKTVNGLPEMCESTTYHSNTYETGRVKFEKDLEHSIGYTTGDREKDHGINHKLMGKWIGIKGIFYNRPDGSVMLEQWIDEYSTNNWHLVLKYNDNGNWGGGYPNCGGSPTQIITWGGPIVLFRWDNISDMDVKFFSVREIQPPI